VPTAKIRDIKVDQTYVDGRLAFERTTD
jgi:hypothetical protein